MLFERGIVEVWYEICVPLEQVAATPDLMLAYIDVFLGGDEKRPDLPPRLMQRLPMSIIFGGEGSYMAPYSLHSDNLLTSLIGQVHVYSLLDWCVCIAYIPRMKSANMKPANMFSVLDVVLLLFVTLYLDHSFKFCYFHTWIMCCFHI